VYNANDNVYQVFCDFTEPGFVWTLIESFSFSNKAIFEVLSFMIDQPLNQEILQWNKHRLSLGRMSALTSSSTHLRATCNYQTGVKPMADFFRASLQEITLFSSFSAQCITYEEINIRGISCRDCTVATWHPANQHLHANSFYTTLFGCNFAFTAPGNAPVTSESNFGYYKETNPVFGCTSSSSSTTQYWLGTKRL
jgi:hypothetical protein